MALDYPWQDHPAPGTVREVAPGVLWLTMPMPGSLAHINLYLLRDGAGWWLLDTGLGDDATRELWTTVLQGPLRGAPVHAVLCTHMHPDHVGNALFLTDRFQAPLYMSRAEYFHARAFAGPGSPANGGWLADQYYLATGMPPAQLQAMQQGWAQRRAAGDAFVMPAMPTGYRRLRHGESLQIGGHDWQVLVGSGHSPEHVCLHSRDLGLLLSGDQVLPRITSNVSVFPTEPEANPLADWLDSHNRFLGLVPADTLVLPAHNLPFRGVRERLRDLVAHHEDRMLAIEEHCADQAASAMELLPVLFRRQLDPRQQMMALGEAVAHLHLLLHRNRLARSKDSAGVWRYRAIDPSLARRAGRGQHLPPDDLPELV